jgi:tetratricopeptide (TPR) repeat protein
MRATDRISEMWRLLRERSSAGRQRRQRLAATAGVALFASAFLVAVGLGIVVEIGVAVVLLALVAVAVIVLAPHVARSARNRVPEDSIRRAGADGGRALRNALDALGPRVSRAGSATVAAGRRGGRAAAGGVAARARELSRRLSRPEGVPQRPAGQRPTPSAAPERDALRLNATGVALRRDGSPAEAAEQHRAALAILERLGDRRPVALTMNNLALALSHDGDDRKAVELFERAAGILAELGDTQEEGQVIANLGLVHRRHGRQEKAHDVLELALAKLAPASRAYRTVEAELRRAG